jgi:hypothetical protein
MIRTVLAAALALALPLAAAAQVRSADLQRGLVAAYALDGDAVDAVTRFRATPVATRPVEGRNGERNGALWFDGARSAVNLGSALQPARFTLAAWVRPDASDRVMVVVSKIRNLPGHWQKNLELRLEPGGRLFVHVPSGRGWEAAAGARPVPAGRWTHVAATYDGSRAQLFVDGVPDGQPLAVRYEQSQTDTWIGARPEGGGRDGQTPSGPTFFFAGAIEDVRIWDRALSDAELAVVSGRAPPAPEPGRPPPVAGPGPRQAVPLALYPLDGGAREVVAGADGALAGTKPAEDRSGNPRGAIALAGKDHVDLGVRSEPERFSLAIWIRPARPNREQVIFSKASSSPRAREKWLELRTDSFGRVVLKVPGESPFESGVATAQKLAPNRWTHVAATFDGERAALYLDGAPAGEARVAPFEASRGPAFVGARPDLQGGRAKFAPLFEGRLDDLRIFRGALTPDEVLALAREDERVPPPVTRGDDDEPDTLLVRVDRALLRYDAACTGGDARRIAKVEEKAVAELQEGLRGARLDRDAVERVRYVVRELESGRGRHDPMSLDRKRSALHGLSEALWTDMVGDLDDGPRPYPGGPPHDDRTAQRW